MYFVPDGTKVCGLYECECCAMRFLHVEIVPQMVCPYCDHQQDMEFGPDDEMMPEAESAKLIRVVQEDEVEMVDALLSLALTGGDYDWL